MSHAPPLDLAAALSLAERLADAARAISRRYFRTPVEVARKSDGTPVTIADREIETEMRRMIRAAFPGHGIRGEEFAAEGSGELAWVLDPIDGTKSFISGYPLFGSLIALCQSARPVLGVIEAPALGERWVGCEGRPTLCNGREVRTRAGRPLGEAVIYTTTLESYSPAERRGYEALAARTALRRFGGDCYIFGMLASGFCDLAVEVHLKPHDYMALIPVIEGAGGKVSDWRGAPLPFEGDGRLVAAGSEALWQEAVAELAKCGAP
jgi:myo-inositol-1(or 4)-monophosphatase